MAKTDENLKAAFADESQANRLYLTFAKKADEEGRHMLDLRYAKRKIHENEIES